MMFRTGTCRDFTNLDLHGECRMENNNHRYLRQNGRKNYLCHQSLHDHFNFFVADNRRCQGKKILFSLNKYFSIKY